MRILFTICGRAGSKGLRNKNLKTMNGIPLVYYTLAAIRLYLEAHDSDAITVALNTDSPELIELVKRQDAIKRVRIVERKPELADDVTPKVSVIKDTLKEIYNYNSQKERERNSSQSDRFDVVVDLDITSPLRRLCDLEETIRQLTDDPACDVAFSAVHARRNPYFNMVESRDGYYKKVCDSGFTARQQAPEIYELNASIYAYRPSFLQSDIHATILDYNCRVAVMPDYLVLDIDSEEDFEAMELLTNYFVQKDTDLREVVETAKEMMS